MDRTSKRFVVVTGCTQGLGYHAVAALAKAAVEDTSVVMACRDVAAARAAAQRIATETRCDPGRMIVIDTALDLADLASVRAYAAALRTHLAAAGSPRGVTRLVNNAGIGGSAEFRKTAQGFERIFATNHLGHFLLTLLLLPASSAADAGGGALRVVNVSSEVHDPANGAPLPDPAQHWPDSPEAYDRTLAGGEPVGGENPRDSGGRRYSRSKLCNVFFTNELARRMGGAAPHGVEADVVAALAAVPGGAVATLAGAQSVEVLAFNPGLMLDTGFFTGIMGGVAGTIARWLTPIARLTSMGRFLRSGPASGEALARIASCPASELPVATAAYYDGPTTKPSSEFSRSRDGVTRFQQELWAHSLRWAKVTPEELAEAGLGG
jgi:NAD(P)-dependent dehydrogenase (short-subunit alcohol dehydrogenase family)